MTVDTTIVNTFEVSAKSKTFHLSKEIRVIGKRVLERTMLLAGLPHEDASALFQYLRFNDSGIISKICRVDLTLEDRLHCLMVAVRA
jgi:hypothetical protein